MAYTPGMYYPQPFYPTFQQPMPQMAQQVSNSRTVEVVPVANEEAVESFPVAVGTTQEFVAQDDSFVAFKTNGVNGNSGITYYDRRPPTPPTPKFDPSAYVTREELESRLAAIASPKRGKREAEE